jgi:hypothetical protein
MNKRRTYDVSPKGDQWTVKQRGAERAVGNFDKKSDAVGRAREVAKNQPLSQVVVRKQDGVIQTEYVDEETDLIALAQYHVNHARGRGRINQKLMEEYTKDAELTENHRLLATLPFDCVWTTNYDH